MFSQRKSFFKGKLFYLLLLGLFAFGYWVNQTPTNLNNPDNINTDSNINAETEKPVDTPKNGSDSYDIMDNIIGGSNINTNGGIGNNDEISENSQDKSDQGYYLVKEIDGVIKIFYYDQNGKENLIRSTDIAFSLLSENDQVLFQQGVIKHTLDELEILLQDFES